MRRASVILWLALSATAQAQSPTGEAAAPQPTAAATESARVHFKLGVDFYRERNFRAALIEFKRAYADAPHYKLLYNLGQAALELQEYASAIDYFTEYLKQGGDELTPERKQEVEQSIGYLESRMGQVSLSSNRPGAEIYLDDTLVGRAPLAEPVRVGAGRHKFAALLQGLSPVERVLDIAAGDQVQVTLDFEERPLAAAAVEPEPAADYVFEREGSNTAAIAMGVTTAVLGAGAITLTVLTAVAQKDYRDELEALTSTAKLADLRDDAKAKALVTDILWGATLVSGIVTTVLIVTGGGSEDARPSASSAHSLRVGVGPTGATLVGRF